MRLPALGLWSTMVLWVSGSSAPSKTRAKAAPKRRGVKRSVELPKAVTSELDSLDVSPSSSGAGRGSAPSPIFPYLVTPEMFAHEQLDLSNRTYPPHLVPPFVGLGDRRHDVCHEGYLVNRDRIAITFDSRIMAAELEPFTPAFDGEPTHREANWVVKYVNDCYERLKGPAGGLLHPGVMEASYLFLLQGSGLTPYTIYISPPAQIQPFPILSARIQSEILQNRGSHDRCAAAGAEVRFIVQQRAGQPVTNYMNCLVTALGASNSTALLSSALRVTIKVVQMLERLHQFGILHGDIHSGNILFASSVGPACPPLEAEPELLFIDFGMAEYFPSQTGSDIHKPFPLSRNTRLAAPWSLMDHRAGRRDDVYRAIEMLGRIIGRESNLIAIRAHVAAAAAASGVDPADEPKMMPIKRDIALGFKLRCPLFVPSACFNPAGHDRMGLGEQLLPVVQAKLQAVMDNVMSANVHPDSTPSYSAIVSDLTDILNIVP